MLRKVEGQGYHQLPDGTWKRNEPAPPVCPYCLKADATWAAGDLLRGKRERPGALEYHCYAAKVMD